MGNKSQKKTNQLLGDQTARVNQFGGLMNTRSDEQYTKKNQFQDMMMGQYQGMLNSLREGTADLGSAGGWVGPDYSGVQGDWENLKETGGWSDEDKAGFRSWTTAPISGFYSGLKRDLERSNRATGGYAGYNAQSKQLGRDAAREGYHTALESESAMQKDIRDRKLGALQQLTQMAASKAHSTPGSSGSFGSELGILDRMARLGGDINDLPYSQMQLQSFGPGISSVTNRVDETPGWQKALTSFIPSAVSGAIGAFSSPGKPKSYGGGGASSGYGAYGSW